MRKYGRIYIPDTRDKRFTIPRTTSHRQWRYWDDRRCKGDQGDTPHCVGFAWMHWLQCAPIANWLNADGLYRLAQLVDEYPGEDYDGTSVRGGAKVLHWLGLIEEYRWTRTFATLVDTVLEKAPVVLGTDWYSDMDELDEYHAIHAKGRILGGHAYLITGVNVKTQYFRICNSWGEGWGYSGRAWIGFADMKRLIRADGEVCLAIERKA